MISTETILALDMATTTGWASWNGERVDSGVWRNPFSHSDSPGAFFQAVKGWLLDMWLWHHPKHVVYEHPHHRGRAATEVTIGMQAHVQVWAYVHGASHGSVPSGTLKKWAAGNGRAGKDQMVVAARRLFGVAVTDDNEADALCVLAWARENLGS